MTYVVPILLPTKVDKPVRVLSTGTPVPSYSCLFVLVVIRTLFAQAVSQFVLEKSSCLLCAVATCVFEDLAIRYVVVVKLAPTTIKFRTHFFFPCGPAVFVIRNIPRGDNSRCAANSNFFNVIGTLPATVTSFHVLKHEHVSMASRLPVRF